MTQPSFKERLFGPLITLLATALYHWLVVIGHAPVTVAILFPFIVAAAFTSGLRAGVIAALWVGGYSAWLLWATDPLRVIVIALSAIAITIMVGVLKRRSRIAEETRRKAAAMDELNGNIHQLHRTEREISDLMAGWNVLNEEARRRGIKSIHDQIAALTTITAGWRELWKEKQEVIEDHEKGAKQGRY